MESFPKMENSIGSVVIEILSFRFKKKPYYFTFVKISLTTEPIVFSFLVNLRPDDII